MFRFLNFHLLFQKAVYKLCLCMFFFSSFLLWLSHHFLFHSCSEHNSHFQSFPQMFSFLHFHLLFPKYTQVVSGLFACVCFCVCVRVCVCVCVCVFYCDCQMCILINLFYCIVFVVQTQWYWHCVRMWWLLVLALCQNVVIIENCVRMWRLLIIVLEYGGYWHCVRMWWLLVIVAECGTYWYWHCVRMWWLLKTVSECGDYWYLC